MVGVDRLRLMASELYGDNDPVFGYKATSPFRITEVDGSVIMELDLPLVEKSDLDVYRHGHELYVRLGPYRRSFILPDALHRREVTRARLEGSKLQVTFTHPNDVV